MAGESAPNFDQTAACDSLPAIPSTYPFNKELNSNGFTHRLSDTIIDGIYIKDTASVTEAVQDLITLGFSFQQIQEYSGVSTDYLERCYLYLNLPLPLQQHQNSFGADTEYDNGANEDYYDNGFSKGDYNKVSDFQLPANVPLQAGNEIKEMNDELFNYSGDLNLTANSQNSISMNQNGRFADSYRSSNSYPWNQYLGDASGQNLLGNTDWLNKLTIELSSDEDDDNDSKDDDDDGGNDDDDDDEDMVDVGNASQNNNSMNLTTLQKIKEEKLKQIEKLRRMIKERESQKQKQQEQKKEQQWELKQQRRLLEKRQQESKQQQWKREQWQQQLDVQLHESQTQQQQYKQQFQHQKKKKKQQQQQQQQQWQQIQYQQQNTLEKATNLDQINYKHQNTSANVQDNNSMQQKKLNQKKMVLDHVKKLSEELSTNVAKLESNLAEYKALVAETEKSLNSEQNRLFFYNKKAQEVEAEINQIGGGNRNVNEDIKRVGVPAIPETEIEKTARGIEETENQINEQKNKIHQLEIEEGIKQRKIEEAMILPDIGDRYSVHPAASSMDTDNDKLVDLKPENVDGQQKNKENYRFLNSNEKNQNRNGESKQPYETSKENATNAIEEFIDLSNVEGMKEADNTDKANSVISHTATDSTEFDEGVIDKETKQNKEKDGYSAFQSSLLAFKSYRFSPFFNKGSLMSNTWSNRINYNEPFCPNETAGGRCNDASCKFQHFNNTKVTELDLIKELGKCFPKADKEAQAQYKNELKQYIVEQGDANYEQVLSSIIQFRNSKMGKDSFLDWLHFEKAKRED